MLPLTAGFHLPTARPFVPSCPSRSLSFVAASRVAVIVPKDERFEGNRRIAPGPIVWRNPFTEKVLKFDKSVSSTIISQVIDKTGRSALLQVKVGLSLDKPIVAAVMLPELRHLQQDAQSAVNRSLDEQFKSLTIQDYVNAPQTLEDDLKKAVAKRILPVGYSCEEVRCAPYAVIGDITQYNVSLKQQLKKAYDDGKNERENSANDSGAMSSLQ